MDISSGLETTIDVNLVPLEMTLSVVVREIFICQMSL
jgi:hypothetical protein